jgi:polyhydroxyalkanoate synthesis regulator phasin
MARTTRSTTALTVKDNAQHIWLAGLGALATAGEEGSRVFEELVEKGAKLEKTGRARLEKVLHKAQGRARTLRGEAEGAFGGCLPRSIRSRRPQQAGIPTRKETRADLPGGRADPRSRPSSGALPSAARRAP